MNGIRFPNESPEYRSARDTLLEAETELRRQVAEVARLRQQLPAGGEVPEDYVFDEWADGKKRQVRLSELFDEGRDALFLYSFMYGPEMPEACPMCSSILDGFEANGLQLKERLSLATVVRSPIERLAEFAKRRGWEHLRLLSAEHGNYARDYFSESESGDQMPMGNVFVKRDGVVHHFWGTELLYAELEGHPRHMDLMWPLWNVLDTTPAGRGENWYPPLWPSEE